MKRLYTIIGIMAALVGLAGPAGSQGRTVKLIVPSSAGGVHDVIARLWAERLKGPLGTIVIDNRGGAGGVIGVTEAARMAPDGTSLLLGSNSTHILSPLIFRSSGKPLPFDPVKDFEVITVFATTATAVAVTPGLPVRTLKELVDHAKVNPGKLNYAHGGIGAISHVAGEMFKQLAGKLDIVPVPYRGMGPAQADVINGTISMFVPNITGQVVELHLTGKIRLLAVNAEKPHVALPDLPTASSSGVPGMITQNFFAIFAPAGTPRPAIDRINEASQQALGDKQFQQRLSVSAFDALPGLDAARSRAFFDAEFVRWEGIIKAAGIKD